MELFKHRNLAFGCGCFLALLFASFYFNTAARIAFLVFTGIAILLLVFLLFRLRTPRLLSFSGKALPALLLAIAAIILSLVHFDKSRVLSIDESKEHNITATVLSCQYSSGYFNIYTARMSELNKEGFDEDIQLIAYGKTLNEGDIINSSGYFTHLKKAEVNSYGIATSFEAEEYTVLGNQAFPVRKFLKNANLTLSAALDDLDDDTKALLGALVLGNKQELDPQLNRDFSKIGLSHILALSGMHISIIITLLSFFLEHINMKRFWKELLLILSTLFFVGITGFSDSALRAGFTVTLTILFSFMGRRTSTASALFYSVTVICIIDPYSIFSVSLLLSFFAMLGCIVASRIVRNIKLWQKIRSRILRYITVSLITSTTVLVFTIPIVYSVFGYISLLSPFTNLLLSPLFTLLIYATPIYMVTSWIPYVKDVIGWIIEKISALVILVGKWTASFDGTVIPIINYVQIVGIAVSVLFAALFLVGRKKLALKMVGGAVCGLIVFAVGTGILLHDRHNSTYAGAISKGENNVVFIEDEGKLTVFQIGNSYTLCRTAARELGYHYEIENLVITDYHKNTLATIFNLGNVSYVKNVYLQSPGNESEEEIYIQAKDLAKSFGINFYEITELCGTQNTEIAFSERTNVSYSDVRAIAFSITSQNTKVTYLGSGSKHLYNDFVTREPYLSDVLIIGTAGPKYKAKYDYTSPYLDLCIFLGESRKYAADSFSERVDSMAVTVDAELSRIKFPN